MRRGHHQKSVAERSKARRCWSTAQRASCTSSNASIVAKMTVDERRIGELPEVLAGLQFRRVGRQEEEMDVLGHPDVVAVVPARLVEHEHDLLGGAGGPRRARPGLSR